MLQRSHPVLDLHIASATWTQDLIFVPSNTTSPSSSIPSKEWPQFPSSMFSASFPFWDVQQYGAAAPEAFLSTFVCVDLGNVSMDASGMVLLPTRKGLSSLRYFLKIVWVVSLTPFLFSDKFYLLSRTERYFFNKYLYLGDYFYSCQGAVGHIYSVPTSKTTNCCQHFGLDVLIWFR